MANLAFAIAGNYREVVKDRQTSVLRGLKTGTTISADEIKLASRRDIVRAGLGKRLSLTIQDRVFPPGEALAKSPSAIVFSTASHILDIHTKGGALSSTKGKFLAIPISGSPAEKIRRGRRSYNRVEAVERQFGKLIPVTRPGKPLLLVAEVTQALLGSFDKDQASFKLDQSRGSKRRRRRLRDSGKPAKITIPMFTLVPIARHKKRLKTQEIFKRGQRSHPQKLLESVRTHLAESRARTALF